VTVLVVQIIGLAVQIRRPNPTSADAPAVRLIRYWAIGLMSPPEKVIHGSGTGTARVVVELSRSSPRSAAEPGSAEQVAVSSWNRQRCSKMPARDSGCSQLLAFKEHYIYTTVRPR